MSRLQTTPIPASRQRRGKIAYESGHAAEDIAQRVYTDLGAEILVTRFRRRGIGEIDLIVRHENVLIFCEVKARKSIGDAAACITSRQWSRLEAAANAYIVESNVGADSEMRFDVVLVDGQGVSQLIENAHLF